MNQEQKRYAMKRVDELRVTKTREAEEKYSVKSKHLSNEERYNLIKSSKVTIRSKSKIEFSQYGNCVSDFFDFSKYEWREHYESDKLQTASALINKKARDIKDQIMLGDCKEAIKLISELENIKI